MKVLVNSRSGTIHRVYGEVFNCSVVRGTNYIVGALEEMDLSEDDIHRYTTGVNAKYHKCRYCWKKGGE